MCLCLVTQLGLTLCDPVDCSQSGSSVHGMGFFSGKNTGVGCHFLLQGIFPGRLFERDEKENIKGTENVELYLNLVLLGNND